MNSVSSIMTPDPITFRVPSTVAQVVSELIRSNITGMPVVDSSNRYVGIISRRDVFAHPEEIQASRIVRNEPFIEDSTTIEDAAMLMLRERRRHAAVVDRDRKVIGVITPQDFLRIVEKEYGDRVVKDLMNTRIFPLWEKTPLPLVYKAMRMSGTFTFPVADAHGNFTGLLTDRDLFDRIDVSTVKINDVNTLSHDDPWSWSAVRNVVTYFIEKNHLQIPEEPAEVITIKNPTLAHSNEKMRAVARRMRDGNFNQIPVTTSLKELQGLLFDLDILSVFRGKL